MEALRAGNEMINMVLEFKMQLFLSIGLGPILDLRRRILNSFT